MLAAYAPSKTFLDALTVLYAQQLRALGILVNAACPGFVATDINGFTGTDDAAEGARIAIELAMLPDDGLTGTAVDASGPVPW